MAHREDECVSKPPPAPASLATIAAHPGASKPPDADLQLPDRTQAVEDPWLLLAEGRNLPFRQWNMASGEKMDPASVMPPKKSVMPPTGRPASASEVKSDDSLEVFVTLVMVRVFEKCDTFENCSQKAWGPHLKHLVTQTMQGLIVEKGFWFNRKTIQSVCQAVVKDLQSKFGGKFKLQCALLFRDPGMDHVIIHVVQAHIRELSERLSRKKYRSWKSEFKLWALAFLYFSVYIIAIALSFFIPFF